MNDSYKVWIYDFYFNTVLNQHLSQKFGPIERDVMFCLTAYPKRQSSLSPVSFSIKVTIATAINFKANTVLTSPTIELLSNVALKFITRTILLYLILFNVWSWQVTFWLGCPQLINQTLPRLSITYSNGLYLILLFKLIKLICIKNTCDS